MIKEHNSVGAAHIPMWIILLLLMLLWPAVTAHAGPLDDCEQAQDIDHRIYGCTELIRLFPRSATAFFNRGSAHLSKGDLDRAIADYTTVIQVDPAYSPAYYHRGIAHDSRQQYDQAIADFSKAVEINPRHGGAFDARARIYLKTGRHELALRDAELAVALDPLGAGFLDTRAHVYEALGRTRAAIADYRRVLSGNPSMQSALDGLRRLSVSSAALNAPADAARKIKRRAKPHHYVAQPRDPQEEIECERARDADPAGHYAAYPCWAREALSQGNRRGR
jgi:tetratricopeptide (TPR) repeat protein